MLETTINRAHASIVEWIGKQKFKKKLLGGVDREDCSKKLGEINELYEELLNSRKLYGPEDDRYQAAKAAVLEKLRKLKFKRRLAGGAEEREVLKKYLELNRMYEKALLLEDNGEKAKLSPLKEIENEIQRIYRKSETRHGYGELAKNVVIMAALLFLAFGAVFHVSIAHGTDMYPAILDGDIVLGYRLEHTYLKNDVLVCEVDGKTVLGRMVAKAGDTVNITEDGVLYVNGTQQTGEIAFSTDPMGQEFPYTVPDGCVYLLGDFRTSATDSRTYGVIPEEQVISKVVSVFRRRGI